MPKPAASSASCRSQLQRALGEEGKVLPRVVRGSARFPAQGWYAELDGGELLFLGDHMGIAFVTIAKRLNGSAP